jgi:hypothetical protein
MKNKIKSRTIKTTNNMSKKTTSPKMTKMIRTTIASMKKKSKI